MNIVLFAPKTPFWIMTEKINLRFFGPKQTLANAFMKMWYGLLKQRLAAL